MFETFRALFYVFGGLLALFLILLSLPNSKLRDTLKPVVLTVLCAIYVLSPVDVLPEIALGPLGLADDAAVLIAGIMSARTAMRSGKAPVN